MDVARLVGTGRGSAKDIELSGRAACWARSGRVRHGADGEPGAAGEQLVQVVPELEVFDVVSSQEAQNWPVKVVQQHCINMRDELLVRVCHCTGMVATTWNQFHNWCYHGISSTPFTN